MNRTYNDSYQSNCRPVSIKHSDDDTLESFGKLLERLASAKAAVFLRVIITVVCFVGFIGVIGGVEAETISLGTGIVVSLFMIFIEFLCFRSRNSRN